MPRKPDGDRAMTPAERQSRRTKKLKTELLHCKSEAVTMRRALTHIATLSPDRDTRLIAMKALAETTPDEDLTIDERLRMKVEMADNRRRSREEEAARPKP